MENKTIYIKNLEIFKDMSKKNLIFLLDFKEKSIFKECFAIDQEENSSNNNIYQHILSKQSLRLSITFWIKWILCKKS